MYYLEYAVRLNLYRIEGVYLWNKIHKLKAWRLRKADSQEAVKEIDKALAHLERRVEITREFFKIPNDENAVIMSHTNYTDKHGTRAVIRPQAEEELNYFLREQVVKSEAMDETCQCPTRTRPVLSRSSKGY